MRAKTFLNLSSAAALALALLMTSCATSRGLKEDVFPGLYGEDTPVSMLVMPPINVSTNVDAKDYFYYTLNQALATSGYYVYPALLSLQTLQEESAYDAEMFIEGDISKFADTFGADMLLFTTIKKWEKHPIGGKVTVAVDYLVRSTATGETLYNRNCTVEADTSSNVNNIFVAAVLTAINTALTDYVKVARNCNYFAVTTDIPAGKYHPDHGLDGGSSAGAEDAKIYFNSTASYY